jgi:hypothetical protein
MLGDGIVIDEEIGDVVAESYSVWLKLRDGELGKVETRVWSCEAIVLDASSVSRSSQGPETRTAKGRETEADVGGRGEDCYICCRLMSSGSKRVISGSIGNWRRRLQTLIEIVVKGRL